jgi:oxaloacetate decarboxylase alpha subunit
MTYGHSATETMVSMLEDTNHKTSLNLLKLDSISEHFKKLRHKYSEFEGSLKGVDVQMLIRQVPGGMLSNLETQLKQLNQEENINNVINEIPQVRKDLGYVPLVTPVSQIIGAQALANIVDGERYKNLSMEMVNLISGRYGNIFGDVDEELKRLANERIEPIFSRPADLIEDDFNKLKNDLCNFCSQNSLSDLSKSEENVLSFALFPYSSSDFFKIN